ncbi:MAG: helix-turn-helix domain-containing protein [bacterium]
MSREAVDALKQYEFPGNVRELKNMIERALIESAGSEITLNHLHFPEESFGRPLERTDFAPLLPRNLRQAEGVLARQAVSQANGNLSEAARSLGISRAKLYRLLPPDFEFT